MTTKSSRRGHRPSQWGWVWQLVGGAGLLALMAGTVVTPSALARLTSDGVLSMPLVERVQALRIVAVLLGVVLTAWAVGRLRGGHVGALAAVVLGAWWVTVVTRVYPHHLLFRPATLVRAALGEELLLGEYDPRARLIVPVHKVLRARYPVINIHSHFRRSVHRTPEQIVAAMDACNVERIVDLDGDLGERLHEELGRYAGYDPRRLVIFASFGFGQTLKDWDYFRQYVAKLADAKQAGAKGLKIWKMFGLVTRDEHRQLISLDDARLEPMWEMVERLSLPILIHVGDPAAFFDPIDRHNERYEELKANPDWSFYGPQYPSLETVLGQFERVVERHPEVTFVLAHLGNRTDDLREADRLLDRHPNLFMDISARVSELGRQPRAAREFFITYQDRLLFGTDGNPDVAVYRVYFRFLETSDEYFEYPFWPAFNYGRWKISGIDLPDEVLRKLYHDNAAKILGLPTLSQRGDRS